MNAEKRDALRQKRLNRLEKLIGFYKNDLGRRIAETRKLFRRRVVLVDPHSHSNHSDGSAVVAVNREAAERLGFDFLFATDHRSLRQKAATKRFDDVSWGQEPGPRQQHYGLLCNTRLFKAKGDTVAADLDRARKLAPFVWIPHPVGWYPATSYAEDDVRALWDIEGPFAIEALNGANKVFRAWDAFDEKAVSVWDALLRDGRRVTPLGASDAHCPEEIGAAWTGVYAREATAEAIIKALNAGRCFATEAAMIGFACNRRPMGSTVRAKAGEALAFRYRVADADGIESVRLISGGKVVRGIAAGGDPVCEGEWTLSAPKGETYYRLESTSADSRRAFSAPVYVERGGRG